MALSEIWDEDDLGPQPERCAGCSGGDCTHHDEFFNAELNGIVFGLFACDCLCSPANVEAAVSS